jgi:hypothetical protein
MGIDLGEYGIAYSVKTPSGAHVADGLVPINAASILRKKGRAWKQAGQTARRFEAFSPKLVEAKRSLTGKMQGVVLKLMRDHQAVPVFEHNIGGLQSGRQIEALWGDVVTSFTGGNNDADRARRNNQFDVNLKSAPNPILAGYMWRKLDGDVVELPFRPGGTISGAFTSTTCPCCRVSVMKAFADARECVAVNDGNVVAGDVVISHPSIRAGMSIDDARRAVKIVVRFHPENRGEGDSTKSGFVCLNASCDEYGKAQHSDISAACEIARRVIDRLEPKFENAA